MMHDREGELWVPTEWARIYWMPAPARLSIVGVATCLLP